MKLTKRGNTWWVTQWDNEKKKQIRMSTGETDRDRAEEKAYVLLSPVLMSKDADMVENAAARVQELRQKASKTTAGRITIADCWKLAPQTHSIKNRPLKQNTVDNYAYIWSAFVRYAQQLGATYTGDVTEQMIADYLKTIGGRSRIVCFDLGRAIFRRLGIVPSPWVYRPGKALQAVHREPLDMEQIDSILARVDDLARQRNSAPDAAEFAVFVRFLLYTGLRIGDAATFPAKQYNRQKGMLSRVTAKTTRAVTFPVHPDLAARISGDDEYLFPSMAKQYLRNSYVLTRRFRRLFDSVDIKGEPHQFCAHALRTTFASICASQGVPMPVIQSWLGHDCPSITRIYARVEDIKQKRLALAKFPTLGKKETPEDG